MNMRHIWSGSLLAVASSLLVGAGCKIADEDRCAPGYTYNPDKLACEKNTSDDAETASETTTETQENDFPTGMGETCDSNEDCSAFEADVCAVNPALGSGYCTIVGCAPGECPSGYQCCSCTAEDQEREICLADQQAAAAVQFGACSTCS